MPQSSNMDSTIAKLGVNILSAVITTHGGRLEVIMLQIALNIEHGAVRVTWLCVCRSSVQLANSRHFLSKVCQAWLLQARW